LSNSNADENAELLPSTDEAERDIDQGRSYNAEEMRQALRGWLGSRPHLKEIVEYTIACALRCAVEKKM
jgi:hypothetical protein